MSIRESLYADQQPEVNVSLPERWASFVLGGMLALAGIHRRSLGGGVLAFTGAALIHRAVTGHCYGYAALDVNTETGEPPLPGEPDHEGVDAASEQSFPASDAPGWTSSRVGAPHP